MENISTVDIINSQIHIINILIGDSGEQLIDILQEYTNGGVDVKCIVL